MTHYLIDYACKAKHHVGLRVDAKPGQKFFAAPPVLFCLECETPEYMYPADPKKEETSAIVQPQMVPPKGMIMR